MRGLKVFRSVTRWSVFFNQSWEGLPWACWGMVLYAPARKRQKLGIAANRGARRRVSAFRGRC